MKQKSTKAKSLWKYAACVNKRNDDVIIDNDGNDDNYDAMMRSSEKHIIIRLFVYVTSYRDTDSRDDLIDLEIGAFAQSAHSENLQ